MTIALLRGINVSGSGKLRMADLRETCTALGLTRVQTYIQSGNVVFEGAVTPADLEAALAERCQVRTTVILRSAAEFAAVVQHNPFPGLAPTKLVVDFLDRTPAEVALPPVSPEELRLDGNHLYIHFPFGQGPSKLPLPRIERSLGVTGTCRNWNTVLALLALTSSGSSTTRPESGRT